MTIGIRHPVLNRGMLFMHLPEMMLFASKQNSTESSYLLKISKLVGNKPDRQHDDHSLRKIRENGLNEETATSLFETEMASKINSLVDSCTKDDLKNIGGWLFLFSAIKGLSLKEDDCLKQYTDFLLKLCEIDKGYIAFAREKNPENKQDIEEINQSIREWLLLPNFDLNSTTNKQAGAELIVALILHWAALFEHFLLTEYEQHEDTPSFINYLPKLNTKDKLECSNEAFLIRFKNLWASKKYSRVTIQWTKLYRDIERSKNKDRPDFETFRVDPNTDKIKKTLTRWRNGKEGFLSIDAIKKELLVLYQPYDSEDFDFSLLIIVFIQLYDNIQRQVIDEGLPKEFIVEQFARYPKYLDLVERRFKEYKKTGTVTP